MDNLPLKTNRYLGYTELNVHKIRGPREIGDIDCYLVGYDVVCCLVGGDNRFGGLYRNSVLNLDAKCLLPPAGNSNVACTRTLNRFHFQLLLL
jgi:hypothetical protein